MFRKVEGVIQLQQIFSGGKSLPMKVLPRWGKRDFRISFVTNLMPRRGIKKYLLSACFSRSHVLTPLTFSLSHKWKEYLFNDCRSSINHTRINLDKISACIKMFFCRNIIFNTTNTYDDKFSITLVRKIFHY